MFINSKKVKGLIALTRWKETIDFTTILILLALYFAGVKLNLVFFLVLIAHFITNSFAFMINDIEDAPDDRMDAIKLKRNPISNGTLTPKEGYFYTNLAFFLAIGLYLIIAFYVNSVWVIVFGLTTLIADFLYSWKRIRLKNIPILDFITHGYMLSAGLFLTAYFAFSQNITIDALLLTIAIFSISAFGELENEMRDFEVDTKAKIFTTAAFLGKKKTIILQLLIFLSIIPIILFLVFKYLVSLSDFLTLFISFATIVTLFYLNLKIQKQPLILKYFKWKIYSALYYSLILVIIFKVI